MIKEFKNKWNIEVTLYDLKNRAKTFQARQLGMEDFTRLEKLYNQMQDEKTAKNTGKVLREQMAVVFGKRPGFYRRYSIHVINDCLKYVTECFKNPSETQEESAPT